MCWDVSAALDAGPGEEMTVSDEDQMSNIHKECSVHECCWYHHPFVRHQISKGTGLSLVKAYFSVQESH
jgi:hypothetical protein